MPVRTLVLVAEAADDLEVAVHARDHQDLLEDLRRLRERVELARMQAARHEEVARAFGRRLGQNRRLDFPEAVGIEILPHRHRDPVPQADVVLQTRPAQIEITVSEPRFLRDRGLLRDLKRRRLRLVEDPDLAREDFDVAGRQLRIDRVFGAPLDDAADADDELGPQFLRGRHQRFVLADDDLGHAGAIADVDERDAAEIADAVHPSEQHCFGPDVFRAQGSAGVRSRQISKRFSHSSALTFEFPVLSLCKPPPPTASPRSGRRLSGL